MRPPLIRTDMRISPLGSGSYLPPAVTLMDAFFQLLPLTSVPSAFSVATAAFAMSVRYAPADGAFLITLNCRAILAVVAYAAGSITPTPFGAGQMSALISFICQVWWPLPRVEPFFSTSSTHDDALSRQYAQPFSEAA